MSEEVKNNQQTEQVNEEVTEQTDQVEQTQAENGAETSETTEETSEGKTFTQAEIDEIVAKRLERERKKYADYDDIKQKATEYEKEAEERRLAEMSEKERAEEQAKQFEQEKEALAKQLEDYRTQVQNEKVRNDFIKKAQAANIQYVDDALQLADLSGVNVNEDGVVEGVDDVVKSLIEHKPFLIAQKQRKAVGDPTNSAEEKATDKTKEQLLKEAAEKARRTGKPEDKVAYSKLKRELG